jgi:uncharacterized protein YndB with AHSA1/START domain
MNRNYTVSTQVNRPVDEVFRAVVERDVMEKYFTTRSSSSLVEGQKVGWFWEHWGENSVFVNRVIENKLIELTIDSSNWSKTDQGYDVKVIFEFDELSENSTRLSISEQGWKTDADGLKASHENCGGWQHMAVCLKAWVEYGIDLRV